MSRLIVQVSIFIALLSFILIAAIVSTNRLVKDSATFKVKSGASSILLGHSHPQCAVNDSLISSLANLSDGGESYFYTYYKAIELLKHNKDVKNVLIEFGNNQIDEEMNEWTWGDKYVSHRYHLYAPFMDMQGNKLLFKNNFKSTFSNLSVTLNKNLRRLSEGKLDFSKSVGGYYYLDGSLEPQKDLELTAFQSKSESTNKNEAISNINISYLEMVIAECKKENVNVYLIRSPVHPNYPGLSNELAFQKILNSKFKNIEYLDFVNLPLPDSEFADLEHLNHSGATKFSMFLNKLLNDGLLQKVNKQEIINREMAKVSVVLKSKG